jgi:hypothetical protein
MKYYTAIPEWYRLVSISEQHKIFGEYRTWLEENIGVEHKDWEYNTGDIHARGVSVPTKGDLIAFKLKFKI